MRKVFLLCVITIFLVACGMDEERYDDFDIIDVNDPYDERGVIEEAMNEQRTILKPGFIPDPSVIQKGFDLTNDAITYDPATEELEHEVTYSHKVSDLSMTFAAEKNTSDDRYEEAVADMIEQKPFDDHEGFYGYIENKDKKEYTYALQTDDTSYFFKRGWWDEDFFDEEFVKLLGESLRTEADGAYDYFYDDFAFKLDSLHFPLLSKDVVDDFEITIQTDALYLRYDLAESANINFIVEANDPSGYLSNLSEIDEVKTDNGISLTVYEAEDASITYYTWEKDETFYSLVLDANEGSLTTDEIYAIIDSSIDDTRSFENEDVFDEQVDEPSLTDVDKAILEKVKDIAEEQDAP